MHTKRGPVHKMGIYFLKLNFCVILARLSHLVPINGVIAKRLTLLWVTTGYGPIQRTLVRVLNGGYFMFILESGWPVNVHSKTAKTIAQKKLRTCWFLLVNIIDVKQVNASS